MDRSLTNLGFLIIALSTSVSVSQQLSGLGGRGEVDPAIDLALLEERNEGLVCLSGCARHGLAVRDPNGAARLAF